MCQLNMHFTIYNVTIHRTTVKYGKILLKSKLILFSLYYLNLNQILKQILEVGAMGA